MGVQGGSGVCVAVSVLAAGRRPELAEVVVGRITLKGRRMNVDFEDAEENGCTFHCWHMEIKRRF